MGGPVLWAYTRLVLQSSEFIGWGNFTLNLYACFLTCIFLCVYVSVFVVLGIKPEYLRLWTLTWSVT